MAENILKLSNLTKSYILGTRKNALKAQKQIERLQSDIERLTRKYPDSHSSELTAKRKKLAKAQQLFVEEEYEESYYKITGETLKYRPKDKGNVVHALRGVNLEIKEGDLVAIVGPSGSGKSTLLNMLGLLDQPTSGEIYLRDEKVTNIRQRRLPGIRSTQLGFVFQSFNLIPTLTAVENVMLPLRYAGVPKRKRHAIARKALEKVGLGNRINHRPNELSGGERQRVAIARSIVNSPAVIFGDELTGELDSKMTNEVMKLIVQLNQNGQTFIIVTHNPEVAKMCKRTIHVKDGKIHKESV